MRHFQVPKIPNLRDSKGASVSRTFIDWIDLACVHDVLFKDSPAKTNQCDCNQVSSGNGQQTKVFRNMKNFLKIFQSLITHTNSLDFKE